MVPETVPPVQLEAVAQHADALLEALADRLASRLLVVFERCADIRALTLATLDLNTMRNLLAVAGNAPELDKVRELAARVAEQLQAAARGAR